MFIDLLYLLQKSSHITVGHLNFIGQVIEINYTFIESYNSIVTRNFYLLDVFVKIAVLVMLIVGKHLSLKRITLMLYTLPLQLVLFARSLAFNKLDQFWLYTALLSRVY